MSLMVNDESVAARLIAERRSKGLDRHPWQLTLYRPDDSRKLIPVAVSSAAQSTTIHLKAAPLGLTVDVANQCLRVTHRDGALLSEISIR